MSRVKRFTGSELVQAEEAGLVGQGSLIINEAVVGGKIWRDDDPAAGSSQFGVGF